jgi:7-carboxy-7-deazaguanine synthase
MPHTRINADTLSVWRIERSVLGSSRAAGRPCVFVRLAGCPVRCSWCDLPERGDVGREMPWELAAESVRAFAVPLVEIGGAEPLAQPAAARLAYELARTGHAVQVATSGARDISVLPSPVTRLMDVKGPSSGAEGLTYWLNFGLLRRDDEVRFPVADRRDYEYAREILEKHRLANACRVVFRPIGLAPPVLAEWMAFDVLDAALEIDWRRLYRFEGA